MSTLLLKTVLLTSFCFLFSIHLWAQSWEWAEIYKGGRREVGYDIAVDANGNSYVTGMFDGIDNIAVHNDSGSVFLAKYDASGTLLSDKKAEGSGHNQGNAIAIDASGNSYVTGVFEDTLDFGNGIRLVTSDFRSFFVAKYSASGNFLWAKKEEGSSWGAGNAIAVDANGNSYVTGIIRQGNADFGNGISLISSGVDIFLAKYDPSGTILWAKNFGNCNVRGLTTSSNGNVYITGSFSDNVDFGNSISLISSGEKDIFLAKYNASGQILWAKKTGGSEEDEGFNIAVDANGNSYVTGSIRGNTDFGNGISLISSGENDIFVAKYNASGQTLWAKKAGGDSWDYGKDIVVDANGNSYVTGSIRGNTDFGNGIRLIASGTLGSFVAKYNASGQILWVKKIDGSINIGSEAIAVDSKSNSYVTGGFYDTIDFGSGISISSSKREDAFIGKITPE